MREKRTVMRRTAQVFLLSGLLLGSPTIVCAQGAEGAMSPSMPGMKTMPEPQPIPGMSIYNLTSRWTTQDGVVVDLASLRGRIVVAAMVYTHCKDVCPLTAEKMQEIERSVAKPSQDKVRFVLFSMDWVRDTPDQMRLFAAQHHLDLRHWTLFHADEGAVRELAAALGVSLYREANGDFQHSIAIYLLDSGGVVAAEQSDLQNSPSAINSKIGRLLVSGNRSTR
jgi:protein SCO1/2